MKRYILIIGVLLAAFPAFAAQQTVTSGTGATHQWSVQKDRINANFTELYGHKVASGSITGDNLTLVLADASTIVVDVSTLLDNTDDQTVTAFSLNSTTNILTLTLSGGNTSTVDLSDLVSAGGATAINDLTDVDTTGKATGKILKFDASGNLVVGDDEIGAAGTGDITGVTAGTGLTGGGDTGAVTLGLSTTTSDAITANTAKVSYTPATPGNIGGTTPAEGHFTTLTAQSFDYGSPAPGTTGEVYVAEDPNNGGSVTGFKAPSQLATDVLYTMPSADGTDGQVWATNGSGIISWVDGGGAETDPVFVAWDKDYADLINQPTIPTVPTLVSAFTNDTGYITTETDSQTATDVPVDTTGFAGNLSATDTSVQTALQTLDNMDGGSADLTAPGPIGSVTPNTGAFTTLIAGSFDYGAPAIGETGEIGLTEDPANGTSTVTIKADADVAADTTILVPSGVLTPAGNLAGLVNVTTARTNLGLVIGTNVQAYNADLADLADGSLTGSKVGTGIVATNVSTGIFSIDRIPTTIARVASVLSLVAAPALATSTCTAPSVAYDATNIYLCVATDTWVKAALATW